MLILCRISIVGFHLLFLAHIVQPFVLLTANVEDVKKIARKFVSDSLAEKIVDFIARATKNITENSKVLEENNSQDSSQVSAENKMYNPDKAGNDQSEYIIKSEEDFVLDEKTTAMAKKSNIERKQHKEKENKGQQHKEKEDKENDYKEKEDDDEDEETEYVASSQPSKHKKNPPKPLHRRSRYIDQGYKETTEKSNINEENTYKNLKEPAIKYVEDEEDIISTTSATKSRRENNKNKTYHKPNSSFDSGDATVAGIPDDKDRKEEKLFTDPKSDEITTVKENDPFNNDNKKVTKKAVNDIDQYDIPKNKKTVTPAKEFDQYDIPKNKKTVTPAKEFDEYDIPKNTKSVTPAKEIDQYDVPKNKEIEMVAISTPLSENNINIDSEVNNIIPTEEKVTTSDSLVKENDPTEEKWWEKELPTRKQDVEVQAKGKSWF